MKLEIVNFKQAKALKELGFPQLSADYSYSASDDELLQVVDTEDYMILAPSLELVAKWLRDFKKRSITISWMPNVKKYSCICGDMNYIPKEHSYSESYKMYNEKFTVMKNGNSRFNSYEEALSAGIDKAIRILNKK